MKDFYNPAFHRNLQLFVDMPSKSDYASLAQFDASQGSAKKFCLRENISGSYSRAGRSIAVHWFIHAISFLILMLALNFQIAEPSSARCWKLYNYYCKWREAVCNNIYTNSLQRPLTKQSSMPLGWKPASKVLSGIKAPSKDRQHPKSRKHGIRPWNVSF